MIASNSENGAIVLDPSMSAAHLCGGNCLAWQARQSGGADRRHALPGHRLRISAIAAPEIEEEVYGLPASNVEVPKGLNKYSSKITQPKSQGASQAMLYATGLSEDSMNKPQVWFACQLWTR